MPKKPTGGSKTGARVPTTKAKRALLTPKVQAKAEAYVEKRASQYKKAQSKRRASGRGAPAPTGRKT